MRSAKSRRTADRRRARRLSAMAQATSIAAVFIAGMAAPVARGEVASGFGSRSARARRAQDLARGRAPLAAVRPRLLRTGPGRGDRTGVRLPTANGESIALGAGGRGLCFGHGRRGRLWAGGERRHHGGADGEREQTRGKLGNRHLTHPPSRPRCAKRARGSLAFSRGDGAKGSFEGVLAR